MIEIKNMSKMYPSKKGVFEIDFTVQKGEVFGFLGPNGAGKTTTIRQLLGFTNATEGDCYINGLETRENNAKLQKNLGYLPGETAFFDHMNGSEFLDFLAQMRGGIVDTKKHELLQYFELDPSGTIRKMSKGMKQKLALVAAFMHDPDVYILDEPTSGLDPLMQKKFIDLVLEEKAKGKTILMSSHMFEEIERTCDRAAIIKDGRIVALDHIHSLKQQIRKSYIVTLKNPVVDSQFEEANFEIKKISNNKVEVFVSEDINALLQLLSTMDVVSLDASNQSLEQIFIKYYGEE